MADYLEEAAAILRKTLSDIERAYRPYQHPGTEFSQLQQSRIQIAKELAALTTIEKGMLPAELTRELVRAMLVRLARESKE